MLTFSYSLLYFCQFVLLGAVPFPTDVPRLKAVGVSGVVTLNEPYETLVPTSLYHVRLNFFVIINFPVPIFRMHCKCFERTKQFGCICIQLVPVYPAFVICVRFFDY